VDFHNTLYLIFYFILKFTRFETIESKEPEETTLWVAVGCDFFHPRAGTKTTHVFHVIMYISYVNDSRHGNIRMIYSWFPSLSDPRRGPGAFSICQQPLP
jgi:hypothetical protein